MNDGGLKHVGYFLHGLHSVVTNSLQKQKSVATLLIKIRCKAVYSLCVLVMFLFFWNLLVLYFESSK